MMAGKAACREWWLSTPEDARTHGLLDPDEPPPFEVVNPEGKANALLVCDHASNRLPRRLAGLGLTREHLDQHIAWDPGAAAVARGLAARLDATLILFRLPTHGERRGIPHVMIEIRQDELQTPAQVAGWVERLAQVC
jgi:predicted N-formylglutamate amidohydrolase